MFACIPIITLYIYIYIYIYIYAIMQTQLRKNIDAAHKYTNTAKEREKKEKTEH